MDRSFSRTKMNSICNEVVQAIFAFVPTYVLLDTCRLVSKIWNANANLTCRKRLVSLRLPSKNSKLHLSDFDLTQDYPFAAAKLVLNEAEPVLLAFSQELVKSVGTTLESLQIAVSASQYSSLMRIMHLPNLQILSITPKYVPFAKKQEFATMEGDLDVFGSWKVNIKKLKLTYSYRSPHFIQLMTKILEKCGKCLPIVDLALPLTTPSKIVNGSIRQLLSFPYKEIGLTLPFASCDIDTWELIVSRGLLPITSLCISLTRCRVEGMTNQLFEHLIQNCHGLRTLTLEITDFYPREYSLEQRPSLPSFTSFKHLILIFPEENFSASGLDMPMHHICPDMISTVNHVSVEGNVKCSRVPNFAVVSLNNIFASAFSRISNFDHVKILTIGNVKTKEKWSYFFKNVQELHCTYMGFSQVSTCLFGHKKMRHLSLEISTTYNDIVFVGAFNYIKRMTELKSMKLKIVNGKLGEHSVKCLLTCERIHLTIVGDEGMVLQDELKQRHLSFTYLRK